MQDTYRAAEVYEPGKLRLVERKVAECPNGKSVKGLVSVSFAERTELVNRAVAETS